MSSVTAAMLGKNIKENKIDKLYYFYGHDVAALESFTKKLVNRLCPSDAQTMNLHKFDGKKPDVPAICDACQAIPMFADRVVVLITDLNMDSVVKDDGDDLRKILKSLEDGTVVIICAGGEELYKNKRNLTDKNKRFADFCDKHGCVCDFALKKVGDMGKAIVSTLSKLGCSISRSDAEYLANNCLCDSAFVKQEIDKLSSYAQGRPISREDIDLLCIKRIESDGYSLAINVLKGNASMVFSRLSELGQQNYEAFEIVGIIGFSLSDIYRAKLARSSGMTADDVVRDFKYPRNREFAVKNAFSECANISTERIRRTLEILSQTDLSLKTRSTGKGGDMLTLEQGLAKSMALRC